MRKFLIVSALVLSGSFFSLASEASEVEISRHAAMAAIQSMKTQVQDLAKASLACDTVGDCLQVPMGKRACGGPTSFEVTSKRNPSIIDFLDMVSKVTAAEDEANKRYGLISICSMEMPPAVACEANLCLTAK